MASLHASRHAKVFKKLRVVLIQELPDPRVILESPQLKEISGYERSQILSPHTMCGRTEKLVDVLELSGNEALFQAFIGVLRPLKPALAKTLEDTLREVERELPGNSSEMHHARGGRLDHSAAGDDWGRQPQAENQRQPQAENKERVVEDAGIYGLNGHNYDAPFLISHLSYNCRDYLSSELNVNPPGRELFHSFCRALRVKNSLVQAAARSGNPTGYLLQTYSTQPEATLENLDRALTEIGLPHVYIELRERLGNGGGGGPEDD